VNLLQITASAEVLRGLRDIGGLTVYPPTTEDAGDGRYRIAAHGPASAVAELEARGCEVRVLMDDQAAEEFNQSVARTVTLPPDFTPPAA
jgi:hypothetical protein